MKGIGFYDSDFFIIKSNDDLVRESLRRLIMTNLKERLGHPFMGGNLKSSLFELNNPNDLDNIKVSLTQQIAQYEPRVTLSNLNISDSTTNENALIILVAYKLIGDPNQDDRILTLTVT